MSEYVTFDKLREELRKRPDLVEVVRCRDCKHYIAWMQGAKLECWANGEPFSVEPDGFCAWGERRDA